MAASEKSERLGLSLWEATDKPERMDFRTDNERLEELVGGHIADAALHLTAAQKNFLKLPYKIISYNGTGDKQFNQIGPFVPDAMFVMCTDMPPVIKNSDGKYEIYWDYWVRDSSGTGKAYYGLGGVGLSNPNNPKDTSYFKRSQASTTNADLIYKMNEKGKKYVAIFLRPVG